MRTAASSASSTTRFSARHSRCPSTSSTSGAWLPSPSPPPHRPRRNPAALTATRPDPNATQRSPPHARGASRKCQPKRQPKIRNALLLLLRDCQTWQVRRLRPFRRAHPLRGVRAQGTDAAGPLPADEQLARAPRTCGRRRLIGPHAGWRHHHARGHLLAGHTPAHVPCQLLACDLPAARM
eukprot:2941008-Prymnesium_polylepis.1